MNETRLSKDKNPQSKCGQWPLYLFLIGQQAPGRDPRITCQFQLVLPQGLRTLQFEMDA